MIKFWIPKTIHTLNFLKYFWEGLNRILDCKKIFFEGTITDLIFQIMISRTINDRRIFKIIFWNSRKILKYLKENFRKLKIIPDFFNNFLKDYKINLASFLIIYCGLGIIMGF